MADNNAKQIAANIDKVANVDLPMKLGKGIDKACLVIERAAKSNAPVQTGTLRNSITHKVAPMVLEGVVGTNVMYAPYVEIGTGIYSSMGGGRNTPWLYTDAKGVTHFTRGSHPHPFLKPAMDENISAILKCFEGLI
jgi:HK97 gp10 family phage protein